MPDQAVATGFTGRVDAALASVPPGPDAAACWSALGAAGLLGEVYRDGWPGNGVRPDRLGTLLAAVDARGWSGVTLSACVQLATVLPLLAEETPTSTVPPGPARSALRHTLAGTATTALAATDVTAGSELTALTTTVQPDGDRLVVTGEKRWITNATRAGWFLVLARRRPGPHFTNFSWVLVPADAPGVRARAADIDLLAGSGVGHVDLDRVRLPADHLVGRPGRGLPTFARHIAVERLAGALWAVALCRRALTEARHHLVERGDLWRRDSVRQRFAEALVATRQLEALATALAEPIATRRDGASGALLKAAVGLTVDRVLAACAQFHGADGFRSAGAQWRRAEAAVFGIGGGTTEVVLGMVADQADRLLAGVTG